MGAVIGAIKHECESCYADCTHEMKQPQQVGSGVSQTTGSRSTVGKMSSGADGEPGAFFDGFTAQFPAETFQNGAKAAPARSVPWL
mmetsp:Transcript_34475/g.75436  ORF Transcript_34475/g.75436 Transcript_34475/m.75436 type:complete len:86 (+) Transcript_34475:20-277(+)